MTNADRVSSDHLTKVTSKLLRTGRLADAKLVLEDGSTYPVHKVILAAASPFFRTLFFRQRPEAPQEKQTRWHLRGPHDDVEDDNGREAGSLYRLYGVPKESFDQVVSWIYKHKMKLTADNVLQVLQHSHYLDCPEVVDQCSIFLTAQISVQNVLGLERFSRTFNLFQLHANCLAYTLYHFPAIAALEAKGGPDTEGASSKNGCEPQDRPEFLNLQPEELEFLLAHDDLNADEKTVWKALIRWCNYNGGQAHLARLLPLVRLGTVGKEFFHQVVMKDPMVSDLVSGGSVKMGAVSRYLDLVDRTPGSRGTRPRTSGTDMRNADGGSDAVPGFAQPRFTQDVILAFGGWSGQSASKVIESYDLRADQWTTLPESAKDPLGERGYLGAAVLGHLVYLVGGTNGEKYFNEAVCFDVRTREFHLVGPMHWPRCYVSLAASPDDGFVYAVGGFDGVKRFGSAERFNPATNQWTRLPDMKKSVRSDAGSTFYGGKLYVAGGFDGQNQLDTVESFSPKLNKWSTVPRMSSRRSGVSLVAAMGELYALGGFDGNQRLNSVEKFSFKTKRWTEVAGMCFSRSNFAAVVVQEATILAMGGYDGSSTTDVVEAFDVAAGTWRLCCRLQNHRSALAACVLRGVDLDPDTVHSYASPGRGKVPGNPEYEDCDEELSFLRAGFADDDEDDVDNIDEDDEPDDEVEYFENHEDVDDLDDGGDHDHFSSSSVQSSLLSYSFSENDGDDDEGGDDGGRGNVAVLMQEDMDPEDGPSDEVD